MQKSAVLLLALILPAGCAGLSQQPPVSTAQTMAGGPPEQMPQSPNSLPQGSQVDAPFTSSAGTVGQVRVGPGDATLPPAMARKPLAGTGTATAPAQPHSLTNSY